MKVTCYLGRVTPEALYADLVRRAPWAEGEAAAIVDQAIEEVCHEAREQDRQAARNCVAGCYARNGVAGALDAGGGCGEGQTTAVDSASAVVETREGGMNNLRITELKREIDCAKGKAARARVRGDRDEIVRWEHEVTHLERKLDDVLFPQAEYSAREGGGMLDYHMVCDGSMYYMEGTEGEDEWGGLGMSDMLDEFYGDLDDEYEEGDAMSDV